MAAYGGHDAAVGNQIFVTLRTRSWPPASCDVRVKYEQTIADVRAQAAAALGVPQEKLQLWWHKRELVASDDARTLLEMDLHTGSALKAYDLSAQPEYWPEVRQTEDGSLVEVDS